MSLVVLPLPAIASPEWRGGKGLDTEDRWRCAVLDLQRKTVGRAIHTAVAWAGVADLSSRFMEAKFHALQPFVYQCLQGIEVTLKLIGQIRGESKHGHRIGPLVEAAREVWPAISDVLQEEYAFWHESAADIHRDSVFIHLGVDCAAFWTEVDEKKAHEDVRYFLVERKDPPPIDPRLLASLWDALHYGLDDLCGGRVLTVDAFRRSKVIQSCRAPALWDDDETSTGLALAWQKAMDRYLETGRFADLQEMVSIEKRLRARSEELGIRGA